MKDKLTSSVGTGPYYFKSTIARTSLARVAGEKYGAGSGNPKRIYVASNVAFFFSFHKQRFSANILCS
jgi:hypothetical protein